jgi:acylglycerol lipase
MNSNKETTYEYDLWGEKVNLGITKDKFPSDDEIAVMEAKLPAPCEHGWFPSSFSQQQLHYRKIVPSAETIPKAVVVFHHGILSHGGSATITKDGRKLNFALFVEYLVNQQGYALYTFDMLGHGYSEGVPRFYVPDWKNNRDDLENFTRMAAAEHASLPVFIIGESYGGCLALHVAKELQEKPLIPNNFGGLLLLAPAIIGDLPPAPVTFVLRYILAPIFPKSTPFFMPNPGSADRIWKDKDVLAQILDKRYVEMGLEDSGQPITLGTAVQMLNALDEVREVTIPALNTPFCVLHGTQDFAVPIEGTDFLTDTCLTNKDDRVIHYIEGGYHCLPADPAAEEVMEHMIAYIKDRMSKI